MSRRFLLLILLEAMFEAFPEIEAAVLSIFRLLFVPAVSFDLSRAESLISKYIVVEQPAPCAKTTQKTA
jgi:hypothetical protein